MAFKINMSDKVAQASSSYEIPPSGNYLCRITDISTEEVKPGPGKANAGKPFWKVTLVVEEGKYQGQNIFTNVMLFGDPYSLKFLCEAVRPDFIQDGEIVLPDVEGMPDPTPFIGQLVLVKGRKFDAGTRRKNGTEREYDEFQVTFKPVPSGDTDEVPLP